jgi:hypothetical protein
MELYTIAMLRLRTFTQKPSACRYDFIGNFIQFFLAFGNFIPFPRFLPIGPLTLAGECRGYLRQ